MEFGGVLLYLELDWGKWLWVLGCELCVVVD